MPFVFISEEDVKKYVNFKLTFKEIEKSYALFSSGKTVTPKTIAMKVNEGTLFCFPSYLSGHNIFITKLATFYPLNSKKGLPTIQPHINIFDSHSGSLKAVISGRYFAGIRTATTSAVGVKYLFKGKPKVLAIIGSGAQARSHVLVLCNNFPSIKNVNVFSNDKKGMANFVKENQKILKGVKITAFFDSGLATQNADVIACVTTSAVPVVDYKFVKPGACILAVGSMGKDMQEVPDEIMAEAEVVVDSMQQIDEYGEIMGPRQRGKKVLVVGEIGEFVQNKQKLISNGKISVFKHHGLSVTDAALAESIYKNFLK